MILIGTLIMGPGCRIAIIGTAMQMAIHLAAQESLFRLGHHEKIEDDYEFAT